MTTIAYRDGILAADSLCTSNSMRDSLVTKIHKVGPLLIAGSGVSALCERFVDWVKKGMPGSSPYEGSDGGNSIIICPDDLILVFGCNGPWRANSEFYAMGSGEQLALGAMSAGATAAEAVAHAMRFDVHSGGPIRTVRRG